MTVIEEAASLAAHWRRVYVRTGDTNSLRTAEVLAELRAVLVDQDARVQQHAQSIAAAQRAWKQQPGESDIEYTRRNLQAAGCDVAKFISPPAPSGSHERMPLNLDPFTKMQINNSTCFDKNVTRADVPPPPRKPLPAIADLNIAPSKPYIPSSSQTCGSE